MTDLSPEDEQRVREKIAQRRRQIIVHSTLYYAMNESTIPDERFDRFAKHLIKLQQAFPEISEQVEYMRDEFRGYDVPTGFHLPHDDPQALAVARWLLWYRDKAPDEPARL